MSPHSEKNRTLAGNRMSPPKLPWARLLSEGALIIVSVYFAIVLEGMSQDREAKLSAHAARLSCGDDGLDLFS